MNELLTQKHFTPAYELYIWDYTFVVVYFIPHLLFTLIHLKLVKITLIFQFDLMNTVYNISSRNEILPNKYK